MATAPERRPWPIRFVPLCGLLLLAAGCAVPSHEAVLVARDLAAGDAPSQLKEQTPAPVRREVTFRGERGRYRADLYLPANRASAALLLIPGAAERGKDDPRLVAFARTLARARFIVLVPDLTDLRRLQIGPEIIDQVTDAFRYLISGRDFVPPGRAGITAFSYAVGPVVIAASQDTIARQVDFIVGVGGYYNLMDVLTFATTGYYRAQGQWRWLEPNRYGKWIFVLSNLRHLPKAADREALRRLAKWHLAGAPAPTPQVQLSAAAAAVYHLVTNKDPHRVPELVRQLPAGIRQAMRRLDPSEQNLSDLNTMLILVHGRDDTVIPYTQSLALAAAVPREKVFIVEGLLHVDVAPGFADQWRLLRAVDTLLQQRVPAEKD